MKKKERKRKRNCRRHKRQNNISSCRRRRSSRTTCTTRAPPLPAGPSATFHARVGASSDKAIDGCRRDARRSLGYRKVGEGAKGKLPPPRAGNWSLKELPHRSELEERLSVLYCFVSLPRERRNVVFAAFLPPPPPYICALAEPLNRYR